MATRFATLCTFAAARKKRAPCAIMVCQRLLYILHMCKQNFCRPEIFNAEISNALVATHYSGVVAKHFFTGHGKFFSEMVEIKIEFRNELELLNAVHKAKIIRFAAEINRR